MIIATIGHFILLMVWMTVPTIWANECERPPAEDPIYQFAATVVELLKRDQIDQVPFHDRLNLDKTLVKHNFAVFKNSLGSKTSVSLSSIFRFGPAGKQKCDEWVFTSFPNYKDQGVIIAQITSEDDISHIVMPFVTSRETFKIGRLTLQRVTFQGIDWKKWQEKSQDGVPIERFKARQIARRIFPSYSSQTIPLSLPDPTPEFKKIAPEIEGVDLFLNAQKAGLTIKLRTDKIITATTADENCRSTLAKIGLHKQPMYYCAHFLKDEPLDREGYLGGRIYQQ